MENEKKSFSVGDIPALLVGGFIGVAIIFATGSLAVLAVKWFISLIKGGL